MKDIHLSDDGIIVFKKQLWHESELVLAKCYNFHINIDSGEITANLLSTFKKAIYEFVKLAFRNFSESLTEEDRRNEFYSKLEAMYDRKEDVVGKLIQSTLPYHEALYEHQADTLKQAYYHQFVFGALDMGLGKTLISASLSRMCKVPRTVIVCPAAVKWNWYRDLTHWGFNELYFTILDSTKRRTMMALHERFLIINYDIIGQFTDYLTAAPIGHFIFDESHYLKNHNSQRFKAVKKIVDHFPQARITFLSGTPVSNRVNDIFAYLKLVQHELGQSYAQFTKEYTIKTTVRGGERVTGGRNLQDLNKKLANFMIRKTKEECLDLPGKIFMSYRFEMDDYREEYDKVIAELAQQKDISSLTGNLHSLNIITSKAKIPGIKELAENIIEQGKKVVVFGSYRDPLNDLEKYFGDRCVKIDGSVDSWTRDQHIQRFHNDPECVVFLGNMKAAGVGINLTNASDVIFMNFPFTPAELYQATDRCDRIGQKSCVNVHYTFCDESIDEYIYEIIVDKEKDINALIDQGKEVILRENTTEILIKKLLKRDDVVIDTTGVEVLGEEAAETMPSGDGPVFSQVCNAELPDLSVDADVPQSIRENESGIEIQKHDGLSENECNKFGVVSPSSPGFVEGVSEFDQMKSIVSRNNDNGSQFIPSSTAGHITQEEIAKNWQHVEITQEAIQGRYAEQLSKEELCGSTLEMKDPIDIVAPRTFDNNDFILPNFD